MISTEGNFQILCQEVLNIRGLQVRWDSSWKTGAAVRVGLQDLLSDLQEPIDQSLIQQSPPTSSRWCISLSHCPDGGALALCPHPQKVGVDIEVQSRLNPKIVGRISSEEEMNKAPDIHYLWVAKEAVFKSLWPNNRDLLISQIFVDSWQASPQGTYKFEVKCNKTDLAGQGLVHSFDGLTLGLFVLPTSL